MKPATIIASIGSIFLSRPASRPDREAAFWATARLTSLEPKMLPSTSLPRLTLVGCGDSRRLALADAQLAHD
jgi:hypothetical protein